VAVVDVAGLLDQAGALRLRNTVAGRVDVGAVDPDVVVLDGQVAGWWRRSVGKESATVEVALFEPPDGAVRVALTAAVERYGAFLEMPVTLALR